MPTSQQPVLQVDNLHVAYRMGSRWVNVVRGVSFEIQRGETFGVVGESGCGKSTLAFSIVDYLGGNGRITDGQLSFLGQDLGKLSPAKKFELRGKRIGMVYQNPESALNPALLVGRQITEVVRHHEQLGGTKTRERVLNMLKKVHMPDPEAVLERYPHQLSGGMQQRVVIAMALITNPDLLIMDEPTSGLDVTTEAAVLDLVNELKQEFNSAILYISHNLGVIARVCDRVGVMYAGQMVESGQVEEIFHRPRHPYALDLLECVPRLDRHYSKGGLRTIPGRVPLPTELPRGCVYQPRCRFARDRCREERPPLIRVETLETLNTFNGSDHRTRCFFSEELIGAKEESGDYSSNAGMIQATNRHNTKSLLSLREMRKYYGGQQRRYIFFGAKQKPVKAVDGINMEIRQGETFSLVGESGCGKSTLGRCVVGLLAPTDGELTFQERNVGMLAAQRPPELRQAMQIVFQHPESTLNPRHKIGRIIGRTLEFFGMKDKTAREHRVAELLTAVRLDHTYADRYPRQLSGGEKQRVAIARAFAGAPNLVVCDEAVSSLDVSVQASILNLLVELKKEQQCAYLFISHDLSVVRYISDRIGVMYLGQMMEIGTVDQIFNAPSHPYTEALLSAVQVPDPTIQHTPIRLEGAVASPVNPPAGCPFNTRCPRKVGAICESEKPPWQHAGEGHGIYCHISLDELEVMQHTTRGSR